MQKLLVLKKFCEKNHKLFSSFDKIAVFGLTKPEEHIYIVFRSQIRGSNRGLFAAIN